MATVPVLPAVTGGVYTTSQISALIAVVDFFQRKPAAELRQTIVQSIPNATFTALLFDTEDLDTDPSGAGGHSTSVNTSRYTAVYAGWYLLGGGYSMATNATGQRGARWAVNGSALNASDSWTPASAFSNQAIAARTKMAFLNVGDYVELHAFQSSTAALNTAVNIDNMSSMSVHWIRNA